jgi:hypothetical protein
LINVSGQEFPHHTTAWPTILHKFQIQIHTTPAAPAVTAIGAVTELSPDAHMTGMLTAREMEYAAANVGVAYNSLNTSYALMKQEKNGS